MLNKQKQKVVPHSGVCEPLKGAKRSMRRFLEWKCKRLGIEVLLKKSTETVVKRREDGFREEKT